MPTTRYCDLAEFGAVAATGPDARSFLQGQFTCDLTQLERHPGQLGAACSPQGRVLELVRCAATADGVLLVLRRALIPALLARLPKYILRARVKLADRSDELAIAGLIDGGPPTAWSAATPAAAGLTLLVASPQRLLLVGPAAAIGSVLAAVPPATAGEWECASIRDGEPDLEPRTAGIWIPQMLNLDLLAGLSFTKGCYTGQEIVARTQHLGRIKRRMLRYTGPAGAAVTAGQMLYSGAAHAGQAVRSAADGDGTHLLAVTGLELRSEPLGREPGGTEFVPAALPGL
ncbi:MAG: folate-binding protein YgfZ [Gammaproteobacteria bacterium]|nr:folate-binding protein YgfZ [Gammaproteobacteria bacterium]